jgi:hypothetical protein
MIDKVMESHLDTAGVAWKSVFVFLVKLLSIGAIPVPVLLYV